MPLLQPPRDWTFLLAGEGPRRWRVCEGERRVAVGLPDADVVDRRTWHMDDGPPERVARDALDQWQCWKDAGLGVAGWLGYDLGAALERVRPQTRTHALPDADLVAFAPAALQRCVLPQVEAGVPLPLPKSLVAQQAQFLTAVSRALEAIRAGEIYQVNLSIAFDVEVDSLIHDSETLAATLIAAQPVPFALVWRAPDYTLLSGSMERFLRTDGAQVSSRPIKGTVRRSLPSDPDGESRWLTGSEKERAENTMIVDMVRNDLQRACEFGSVHVQALCEPTPYQTLWHLESEVHGTLRDPKDRAGLLAATWPPASVTGCPKIQATRVIGRLEGRHRGPYCGVLGVDLPDLGLDLAVGIRQIWLSGTTATLQVGAGIVAQSLPEQEWLELCTKAQSGLRVLAQMNAATSPTRGAEDL